MLVDGRVTYTPDADYFGPDAFEYRVGDGVAFSLPVAVTIDVTPVDDAPVVGDTAETTAEDTQLTGTLTATDVDSTTLTFHVVDGPQHGTLVLDPTGSFTYTPVADFNGADGFTYAANDGLARLEPRDGLVDRVRGERRSGHGRHSRRPPPRTRR